MGDLLYWKVGIMNSQKEIYDLAYKMQKDIAVIKEQVKSMSTAMTRQNDRIAKNEQKINTSQVSIAKWGGIAFGILVALQMIQFAFIFI